MSNIQFNETFYLSTYPDVAAAVSRGVFASGQAHYQANGRFEGRNPNQFFNTSEYLGRYPDVARAGVNPLTHFLTSGAAEGRFANSNEDAAIDLNNNDVADDFNATAYLALYPDVAAQTGAGRPFATAYQHFVQFGQFEGRTATLSNGTTVTGPFVNGGTGGGTPATGSNFALTTGVDNLPGTNGADTFSGVIDTVTTTNTTFTVADTVNGGAGVDNFNILVAAAGGNVAVPTAGVSNVENFFVRNLATGQTATFEAGAVIGEQQVWNDRGTGALSVTGLATGGVVGIKGDNNTTNGATTFTMATATDAVNIAIDGGTKGTAAITRNQTGEAAVTINSTGAANTVGVIDLDTGAAIKAVTINATTGLTASLAAGDFAAGSTLTVTGAGAVNLSGAALSDNLTTVVATGSTGGVNVLVGGGAVKFTGGTGADRVAFGATYASTDTVDGGAGRDTIALDGANFTTANNDALKGLNALTNVEVIEFTGATGATISGGTGATAFTNSTVDQLLFNTAGNDTVELAGARLYSFGSTNAGNATFNSALGQNTLNLSLVGATTAAGAAATVGTLTVNGAQTVNIASTGSTTAANTITSLDVAQNSTISLTGAQALTIGGTTSGSSINGSAHTGVLNITGSAAVDAITGGTGNDILFGRAGADTIVGGAGNDVIQGDGVGVAAVANAAEQFKATLVAAADGKTITFDGVTYTAAAGNGATVALATTSFVAAYNAAPGATYTAVDNGGSATFTAKTFGDKTDVTVASFTGDANGGGNEASAVTIGTQGATAAAATIGNGGDAAAADILTGGLGNDNFRFASGTSVVTAFDTITDLNFGSGDVGGRVDILTFQNADATAPTLVTLSAAQQTLVSASGTLAAAADAVAAIATADGATAQFTYGADTFIFHAGNGASATFDATVDHLVKITGVTGTLDVSDIATI